MVATLTADQREKTQRGLVGLEAAKALQDTIDDRVARGGEGATQEELQTINRGMADYTQMLVDRESERSARLEILDATDENDAQLRAEQAEGAVASAIDARESYQSAEPGERANRDVSGLDEFSSKSLESVFRGAQIDLVPPDGRDIYSDRRTLMSKGDLAARAHSTLTPVAGGNTFTAGWVNDFYTMVEQYEGFLTTMPTLLITDHGRDVKWPLLSQFGTAAAVAEQGTLAGSDLKFGQIQLGAYKVGRYTKISRELFEDNDVPLEAIVAEDFGRSVAKVLDNWFVAGTGTVQPDGILGNEGGTVTGGTGVAGAPNFDNLIDLIYSIDHDVRMENNCCFLMNDSTAGKIAKLKDTDGQYLWRPTLTEPAPRELLGYKIKTSPHVPETGTSKTSVFFGDFRRAMVVRVINAARMERSEHFAFDTDETALRITVRADSKVRDSSAVHCYRGATS